MNRALWVLQRQTKRGWVNDAEGTRAEMQKAYTNTLTTCGHASTISLRIRPKNRKPRKDCIYCNGTGKIEICIARDPDPAICTCGCLND